MRGEDAVGVPLLVSRLLLPPLPDGLVPRPRLARLLDAGARGPVTLLAAPAGWGKTVLLNTWVRAGVPDRPVAWLTAEGDDDRDRFWSYLHASLHASGALDGRPLEPPEPDLGEAYLTRLANSLADLPRPAVVIIDDFHKLEDHPVLADLDFVLRHAAGRLHLVISTRVDPSLALHRWRLDGELTEIRAPELSMTATETAALLARQQQVLPDAQLTALHEHTEGWPAGLRFAALSMRDHPDPARLVDELTGDGPGVSEYLRAEVLGAQPPHIVDALLATSVLERVCGDLADALTGRTDGARILVDLERANAFTVALDGPQPWYRYHRLFGELLRAELRRRAPTKVRQLHGRAAQWYVVHGLPSDALRHALAARDRCCAVHLLTTHWHELVACLGNETPGTVVPTPPDGGDDSTTDSPADSPADSRAEDWDEDGAGDWVGDWAGDAAGDPELALAFAMDCLDRRDREGAERHMRAADRHRDRVSAEHRAVFPLMTAALGLAAARPRGDPAEILPLSGRLLDLTSAPRGADSGGGGGDDPPGGDRVRARVRAVALAAAGSALLTGGNLTAAERALRDGLAAAEHAGPACPRLACTGTLALLHALRGELRSAGETARRALAIGACSGRCRVVFSAYAYLALAFVHYEWDRIEKAGRYLDLAASVVEPGAEPMLAAGVAVGRAQLGLANGDLAGGYEALVAGREALSGNTSRHLDDWLTATEANLRSSYGDTDTARDLLTPLLADRRRPAEAPAVALARAYLRDDDPNAAARVLPPWADGGSSLAVRLEAGLLAASAARRVGDDHRASRTLERVLALAEPERFRRLFTRGGFEVRELLVDQLDAGTAYWSRISDLIKAGDALPAERDRRPPPLLSDPLTDRELTVLRYLQGALSNLEIATDLSVSVNTVKTHVRSIYRKLHAAHRRDAVRRARELHVL